jgi:hydrogenase/urease accessory protein HupE
VTFADDFSTTVIKVSESARPLSDIAIDYLYQGAIHIGVGWDHLAFVFCLCIMASNLRALLWTITAFTIGHSMSMALSFFGYVSLPIPPIEAVIAMSIVLLATQAWRILDTKQVQQSQARRSSVIVMFGLIHGLGFASALESIGVAQQEKIAALAFFNIGVEIGQILFVSVVYCLLAGLSRLGLSYWLTKLMLVFTGAAGCFWTIERISGF